MFNKFRLFTIVFLISGIFLRIESLDADGSDSENKIMISIRKEVGKVEEKAGVFANLGIFHADRTRAPTLNLLVEKITKKLNITKPPVLIFNGNVLFNGASDYTGGLLFSDFRLNAFAYGGVFNGKSIGIICLGKEFIDNMNEYELSGIIAHELGHLKNNHIPKLILLNVAMELIEKVLFNVPSNLPERYKDKFWHGIDLPYDFSGIKRPLPVAFKVLSNGGIIDGDLSHDRHQIRISGFKFFFKQFIRRVFEKQADLVAARAINPDAMKNGLIKLYQLIREKHLPMYYFMKWIDFPWVNLTSSHPSLAARLKNIENYKSSDEYKMTCKKEKIDEKVDLDK